jgi:hypothetical protein
LSQEKPNPNEEETMETPVPERGQVGGQVLMHTTKAVPSIDARTAGDNTMSR